MLNKIKIKKDVGERVKYIRQNIMHMTKKDFAELINMKSQYLGAVESGERGLTIEKVIEICTLTGVASDYLLFGKSSTFSEQTKNILKKYSTKELNTTCEILKDLYLVVK